MPVKAMLLGDENWCILYFHFIVLDNSRRTSLHFLCMSVRFHARALKSYCTNVEVMRLLKNFGPNMLNDQEFTSPQLGQNISVETIG